MLNELVEKNRSVRRFAEDNPVNKEDLLDLIKLARLTPSAANKQPLKYFIYTKAEQEKVMPHLKWAGYITDWDGPEAGERPTGFIMIVGDKNIATNYWADPGIAIQTIMLGAVEKGLRGCIMGALNKEGLRKDLAIDDQYEILYVLALGHPAEEIKLEPCEEGNIKYWRDEENVHHVPKRSLSELILN